MLTNYQREMQVKAKRWMNMNVYDFHDPTQLAEEAAAEFDIYEGHDIPEWITSAAVETFKKYSIENH